MSFGVSSNATEAGSNVPTDALFEGLDVPANSAAVLKRGVPQGAPRVQRAVRNQVELRAYDLDASLPGDHQARIVWAFVQWRDLQALHARIRAVEGSVGRSPIDPALMMSLWLYATMDGVGSARELERLCDSNHAYRWLCRGVGVRNVHHQLLHRRATSIEVGSARPSVDGRDLCGAFDHRRHVRDLESALARVCDGIPGQVAAVALGPAQRASFRMPTRPQRETLASTNVPSALRRFSTAGHEATPCRCARYAGSL